MPSEVTEVRVSKAASMLLSVVASMVRPPVVERIPVTPTVLPNVVAPVILAVPATVRREPGVVVPTPTLPVELLITKLFVVPPALKVKSDVE